MKILPLEWCAKHRERLLPREIAMIEYFDGFKLQEVLSGDTRRVSMIIPEYRFEQLKDTVSTIYKKYTDPVLEDHQVTVDVVEGDLVVKCECGAHSPLTSLLSGLQRQYRSLKPWMGSYQGGAGYVDRLDVNDTPGYLTIGCAECCDKINTKKLTFVLTEAAKAAYGNKAII